MNIITLHKFINEFKRAFKIIQYKCWSDFYSQKKLNNIPDNKDALAELYTKDIAKQKWIKDHLPNIKKIRDLPLQVNMKIAFKTAKVKTHKEYLKLKGVQEQNFYDPVENKHSSFQERGKMQIFLQDFWKLKGYSQKFSSQTTELLNKYNITPTNSIKIQNKLFKERILLLSSGERLKNLKLEKYKSLWSDFQRLQEFLRCVQLPHRNLSYFLKRFSHNNIACHNCGKIFPHIQPKPTAKTKIYCDDELCTLDRKKKRQRTSQESGGFTISLTDGHIGTYGGDILKDEFGNPVRICQVCHCLIPKDQPISNETCGNDYCKSYWAKKLTKEQVRKFRAKVKKVTV